MRKSEWAAFAPAWWAPGGNFQTIWGYLLPSPKALPSTRLHEVAVSQGDRLVMCENQPLSSHNVNGVVLLMHGLGGHADSPYMLRVAEKFLRQNWITIRLNHRGAGQGRGKAKQLYHAGKSEDLPPVLARISELFPKMPAVIVGFSLSGNLLLKYLGEKSNAIPENLCGAIAVNPPVKLALSAAAMTHKRNWIYDHRFVRLLKQAIREHEEDFPDFPRLKFPSEMSVYRFDQIVTAPLSGFTSAEDYYQKSSAFQFLSQINLPAVLLANEDDPFVPPETFKDLPINHFLNLHLTRSGGHMGFIAARPTRFGDHRWMDEAIVHYAFAFFGKSVSLSCL
jgi:hypothetical protein